MTEKELRRMGRRDLIEIIAAQKRRELELLERLEKAEQQLGERNIRLTEAGSIAEAAMSVSGVFEAAQAAADTYLRSIEEANMDITDRMARVQMECDEMLEAAEKKAKAMVQEAEMQCAFLRADANMELHDWPPMASFSEMDL